MTRSKCTQDFRDFNVFCLDLRDAWSVHEQRKSQGTSASGYASSGSASQAQEETEILRIVQELRNLREAAAAALRAEADKRSRSSNPAAWDALMAVPEEKEWAISSPGGPGQISASGTGGTPSTARVTAPISPSSATLSVKSLTR